MNRHLKIFRMRSERYRNRRRRFGLRWNLITALYNDELGQTGSLLQEREGLSSSNIFARGLLICQRIAVCSAELSRARDGAQCMLRLATGESTKRSQLDAEHLREQLREVAVEQLAQAPEDERWLIADGSDLRKPYAQEMAG